MKIHSVFLCIIIIISLLVTGCYFNANIKSLSANLQSESSKYSGSLTYINSQEHFKNDFLSLSPVGEISTLSNYSIVPNLPEGVSLDTNSGTISGTPTKASSNTTYFITASDGTSNVSASFQLSIGLRFTVDNNSDTNDSITGNSSCSDSSGNCTLRAAIQELNTWSDIPREVIIPNMTITLESSNISITKGMKITGNGASNSFIKVGTSAIRILNVALASTDTLSLDKVNFQDGKPNENGGAILHSSGTLNITNSTFYNNNALSGKYGGAIYVSNGDLILKNNVFDSNQAPSGFGYGGAVYLNHLSHSTLIEDCIFTNNHSARNGGAIYVSGTESGTGVLTLKNSTLENNSAGNRCGGIFFDGGKFKISNTLFNENTGAYGQLYLRTYCTSDDHCEVNQSVFFTSTNENPITIDTINELFITNSTLIGGASGGLNPALEYIGSIYPDVITIKNSIISNPNAGLSCNYALNSQGNNISSASDCNLTQPTDQVSQTHLNIFSTGSLLNLGGSIKSVELKSTGPAVDMGPINCDQTTDIRGTGFIRPVNKGVGSNCDVGAFELQ